jgi:hypothetical protein
MNYTIHGRISAELCSHRFVPDAQAYLRLYEGNKRFAALGNASVEVVQIVTEEDLGALGQGCLGREPLGVDGDFKIGIDDRQHPYNGGMLLAVLELPDMPAFSLPEPEHAATFWVLKAFRPAWTNRESAPSFVWNYDPPRDIIPDLFLNRPQYCY